MKNKNVLFALNFPGIALLSDQYVAFSKNLEIVSEGSFRCEEMGTCSAVTTCDKTMSRIWDYSFTVRFGD